MTERVADTAGASTSPPSPDVVVDESALIGDHDDDQHGRRGWRGRLGAIGWRYTLVVFAVEVAFFSITAGDRFLTRTNLILTAQNVAVLTVLACGATFVLITAGVDLSVGAVAILGERRIGALPVIEEGRIAGIMSERDVIYCLRDHGAEVLAWPVAKVMTSPAVTVEMTTPVLRALATMTQRRMRHLPVVSGETLCGIVSIGDLVKYRIDRIEREAEAMRDYIQSA